MTGDSPFAKGPLPGDLGQSRSYHGTSIQIRHVWKFLSIWTLTSCEFIRFYDLQIVRDFKILGFRFFVVPLGFGVFSRPVFRPSVDWFSFLLGFKILYICVCVCALLADGLGKGSTRGLRFRLAGWVNFFGRQILNVGFQYIVWLFVFVVVWLVTSPNIQMY